MYDQHKRQDEVGAALPREEKTAPMSKNTSKDTMDYTMPESETLAAHCSTPDEDSLQLSLQLLELGCRIYAREGEQGIQEAIERWSAKLGPEAAGWFEDLLQAICIMARRHGLEEAKPRIIELLKSEYAKPSSEA